MANITVHKHGFINSWYALFIPHSDNLFRRYNYDWKEGGVFFYQLLCDYSSTYFYFFFRFCSHSNRKQRWWQSSRLKGVRKAILVNATSFALIFETFLCILSPLGQWSPCSWLPLVRMVTPFCAEGHSAAWWRAFRALNLK